MRGTASSADSSPDARAGNLGQESAPPAGRPPSCSRPPRRSHPGLAAVLTATLLAACTAGPAPPPPPRRIFLVTVDTLRADHLGAYGYPRPTSPTVDKLAEDGVLFEQAIAQFSRTTPSFASLFTGRYPATTGLVDTNHLPEEHLTLAERLQQAGYATVAVVSNGRLARRRGWSQGFEEYLETWPDDHGDNPLRYRRYVHATRVNELARPLLERHAGRQRLFVWLHYTDPHAPYLLPEGEANPFLDDEHGGQEQQRVPEGLGAARRLGEHDRLSHYVASYDANVRFADAAMSEILEHARRLGLLEDALVIFTSDHGESLGEHDYWFAHGRFAYNTTARVPLIFHWPGALARGARVVLPVELLDLYPTIVDLLALAPGRLEPELEGKSLLPLVRPGGPRPAEAARFRHAFSEAGEGASRPHWRSIQDRSWKLIYHPSRERGQRTLPETHELYHLAEDPLETRDLAAEQPAPLALLRRELAGWLAERAAVAPPASDPQIDDQELQRTLRALGYVE